jgi:hypothetical protein
MKAVEFHSTVAPGGAIEVPPEVAHEIPAGERLRVVVMWDAADPDDDWHATGRRTFEAAYSPEDSIYEKLIDDAEAR